MDDVMDRLPMRSNVRQKLWKIGMESMKALELETTESLARILEIEEAEAKRLVDRFQSFSLMSLPDFAQPISMFDILNNPSKTRRISTGSKEIDKILGGGVCTGRLTEFCGVPGTGKSQLCTQLCMNVQTPALHDGLEGNAVYIDTDGGVIGSRLLEIADAFVARIPADDPKRPLTALDALKRIYYFRSGDYLELIATVHLLRDLITKDNQIKLIIIDSIATHMRYAFEDYGRRARMLNSLTHILTQLAVENDLAVVLTNQMTTQFNTGAEELTKLIPALGLSWGYACAVRVNLRWIDNCRVATVFKSPVVAETDAAFAITSSGIEDLSSSRIIALKSSGGNRAPKPADPPMSSQFVHHPDTETEEEPNFADGPETLNQDFEQQPSPAHLNPESPVQEDELE